MKYILNQFVLREIYLITNLIYSMQDLIIILDMKKIILKALCSWAYKNILHLFYLMTTLSFLL